MPPAEPSAQTVNEDPERQEPQAESAGTQPAEGPSLQNVNIEVSHTDHTPQPANHDVANGVADASTSEQAPGLSEHGRDPTPPEGLSAQSPSPESSSSSQPSAKDKAEEAEKPKDAEKDRASLNTSSHTHTRTQSTRRKDTKPASEIAHTASTLAVEEPRKVTKLAPKAKPSLVSRLFRKLVPCVGASSTKAHDIDFEKEDKQPVPPQHVSAPVETKEKEKAEEKEKEKDDEHALPPATSKPEESQVAVSSEASREVPSEPSTSSPYQSADSTPIPPPLQPIEIPPPSDDPSVVVPPTPTKSLLPREETEGMLSGAVQPPGSTGEEIMREQLPQRDSEHESDGSTSFTDDEDGDEEGMPIDEVEDDEERLIMNGGAGIPIGPDGVPRPLLPPLAAKHAGRKCLVLDLDETLVHSSFKSIQQADYVVPVEIEYHWHNVYVIKRPGVDNFLKKMGEIYEVVVFTASLSKYADPVLDKLDVNRVVAHRLFRESCYNHRGNYVKDLSQLGRPISDTIIIDNSPASYIFHPNNAVPVSSWFNDPHDTELTDLVPFLADLCQVDDVRGVLDGGL